MMSELKITERLRREAYRRQFLANTQENLFMGRFDSWQEALNAVPTHRPTGYDNPESAQIPYTSRIQSWDYPVLYWLRDAFDRGMRRIFDLGGHLGVKYYGFRRVLPYPADLAWTVCDVPAVVALGREHAAARSVDDRLSFTSEFAAARSADVLFASGSLQYLPQTLAEQLATLPERPRRLILNTTATHPDGTFYTVNSIGTAYCPYRIQQWQAIEDELERAGYQRRDAWRNDGKPILVPFEDGGDKAYYGGGCFDRL